MWYKGSGHDKKLLFQNNFRVIIDTRFVILADHSLTISNVSESDEEVYYCEVLPSQITMKANLVVLSHLQAQIYQGGRDLTDRSITYRENDRIEVECKATGARANKVDFKWSADGVRLVSNEHIKIDNGHLVIEKANRDHIRVYQCLADNGEDGTGHASVTINIQCNCIWHRKIQNHSTEFINFLQIHRL